MIDRAEVLKKFGGHCAYCGKEITLATMQVDHIKSKRNGGTDDMFNLNPSCHPNMGMGSQAPVGA